MKTSQLKLKGLLTVPFALALTSLGALPSLASLPGIASVSGQATLINPPGEFQGMIDPIIMGKSSE